MDTKSKIYNVDINKKVDEVVEKLIINKRSKEEKEILYNLMRKVLLNEKTKSNKNNLLTVIENVNCYKDEDIISYINLNVQNIIEEYSQNKYVILKENVGSSNHSLISNLIKYGYIEEENFIKYYEEEYEQEDHKTKEIKKDKRKILEIKELEENSVILIIDDYIGSGQTIINILKEIEKNYKKQTVKIIAYIWQENAKTRINDFLAESEKNNTYEILDENSILEKTYAEKYEEDSTILKYIVKTCDTCQKTSWKFGYKNTGAMITINGLAPNNDISMLWRTDLGEDNNWIPPFSRNINMLVMQKKKEKIIKEPYPNLKNYYKEFCYNDKFNFDEFKMLLLLFNSYCIRIKQITRLLGLDTDSDTEQIIEKFKASGIIKYEADNILEFVDKNVIKQFKKINNQLNEDALNGLSKKCTDKLNL